MSNTVLHRTHLETGILVGGCRTRLNYSVSYLNALHVCEINVLNGDSSQVVAHMTVPTAIPVEG